MAATSLAKIKFQNGDRLIVNLAAAQSAIAIPPISDVNPPVGIQVEKIEVWIRFFVHADPPKVAGFTIA